jgi:tetratricopeptide (TPR) repeat protein
VSPSTLRRFGLLVVAIAIAATGAMYIFSGNDEATVEPVEPAATTKASVATASSSDPSDIAVPNATQTDAIARLLGDARRLAENGQIDQAKAAVDQAAKIIPGSSDIAQARVDIEQMSTPQYRLAEQLSRARLAIAQGDRPAAEAALDAAAQIDPATSRVAELRQELQHSEQKDAERKHRIAALLTEMRQAIARQDLVAADRALNEAERLNIRDPEIDPARIELARAQADSAHSRQQ